MTVKEIFDILIKEKIHPVMKKHYFKKHNLSWNKHLDEFIYVLNIQKSKYNDTNNLSFTINLGVVVKSVYILCWDKMPPKFAKDTDCTLRVRIGDLFKNKHDKWWNIDNNTNAYFLGDELNDIILSKCMPFFDDNSTINAIHHNVYKSPVKNILYLDQIYLFIIKHLIGDSEGKNYIYNTIIESGNNKLINKINFIKSKL